MFYRANAAFWQFPLKIQANEIAGALRISRSAFMRSREELRSAGYLLYEHDPGTRTVKYYLVSNVRPHMLVTPAEMLAGTKSYQDFLSGTPVQKEVNHVAYESCPEAVSGN